MAQKSKNLRCDYNGILYPLSFNDDVGTRVNYLPLFTSTGEANPQATVAQVKLPFRGEEFRDCKVVDHCLTDEQCNELLFFAENFEWKIFNVCRNRKNALKGNSSVVEVFDKRIVLRQLIDCPMLADEVANLVRPFLPYKFRNCIYHGFNFRFRFLKYFPGMRHESHRDSYYNDQEGHQTAFTVFFYLSDETDCVGGETALLDPNEKLEPILVAPQKGRALIFEHRVFHKGCVLQSGFKNALRLDVLYTEPQNKNKDQRHGGHHPRGGRKGGGNNRKPVAQRKRKGGRKKKTRQSDFDRFSETRI